MEDCDPTDGNVRCDKVKPHGLEFFCFLKYEARMCAIGRSQIQDISFLHKVEAFDLWVSI
jgi:hypothetical protein